MYWESVMVEIKSPILITINNKYEISVDIHASEF